MYSFHNSSNVTDGRAISAWTCSKSGVTRSATVLGGSGITRLRTSPDPRSATPSKRIPAAAAAVKPGGGRPVGDHRLRGRSESPGRPGKVLPSSPGPAGVVHDRNPGAHGRAGSSLSGALAHSQRYNGSQRSQITRLRQPMSWLGRNVTVGAFRSGGGWCCGRCCDVVGPRVAALGGFANPPFLACSSLSGCCPIAFVGDDSVGDPCLLRHVLGPPSSRIFCRARVSPRRRAASTEGWRKGGSKRIEAPRLAPPVATPNGRRLGTPRMDQFHPSLGSIVRVRPGSFVLWPI